MKTLNNERINLFFGHYCVEILMEISGIWHMKKLGRFVLLIFTYEYLRELCLLTK